jgi:hypothetical protein
MARPARAIVALLSGLAALTLIAAWAAPPGGLEERMTAAEFRRCGLHRLTPGELAALNEWLDAHPSPSAEMGAPGRALSAPPERLVAYNVSNGKYHGLSCVWARRCTRSCIDLPLAEALARGGRPCKVCGGH